MHPSPPHWLKLVALPLARPKGSNPPAIYLHAVRKSFKSPDGDEQPQHLKYLYKGLGKAEDLWQGFGKAKEGNWKRRIYDTGEKWMDRIEYEEWALKAIDPALAPKPWEAIKNGADGQARKKKANEDNVELLFPQSLLQSNALVEELKKELQHREPHHRAAARRCILLSPLTWPFAILPVIPNFPLFYVLWRAWSHYRAYKASNYLLSLFTSTPSHVKVLPSKELDAIYQSSSPSPIPSSALNSELLLTADKIPKLVEAFGLDDEERKELERAVWQSEQRLRQAEEKAEGGKTTGESAHAAKEVIKEEIKEKQ